MVRALFHRAASQARGDEAPMKRPRSADRPRKGLDRTLGVGGSWKSAPRPSYRIGVRERYDFLPMRPGVSPPYSPSGRPGLARPVGAEGGRADAEHGHAQSSGPLTHRPHGRRDGLRRCPRGHGHRRRQTGGFAHRLRPGKPGLHLSGFGLGQASAYNRRRAGAQHPRPFFTPLFTQPRGRGPLRTSG